MMRRVAIRRLTLAATWIVIVALSATTYRYFVSAETKERVFGPPELTAVQWQSLQPSSVITPPAIGFARGSTEIGQTASDALREFANVLRRDTRLCVCIVGHVRFFDSDAATDADRQLAQKRSDAVAAVLRANGVHPNRIRVEAPSIGGADAETSQAVSIIVAERPQP